MNKILFTSIIASFVATSAMAQTTIVVPQAELAPGMDEPMDVVIYPPDDDGAEYVGPRPTTPTFPNFNRERTQTQNMKEGWTYKGWVKD